MQVEYGVLFVFCVFLATVAQVFLKQSANKKHKNIFLEYFNISTVTGFVLMGISLIGSIFAYRGIDLKYGPILESFGYIFMFVLSWLFFKEKPTRNKIIGIGLIIMGIVVALL